MQDVAKRESTEAAFELDGTLTVGANSTETTKKIQVDTFESIAIEIQNDATDCDVVINGTNEETESPTFGLIGTLLGGEDFTAFKNNKKVVQYDVTKVEWLEIEFTNNTATDFTVQTVRVTV